MANKFNAMTWLVDTAGATSLYSGPCYIGRISWHPTAAGQKLIVQNSLGHVMWQVDSVAAGNDSSVGILDWPNPEHKIPWDGFNVSQIDGGILYVTVL